VVPLGTVLVLVWLHRRWPRLSLGLGALLVANAIVWTVVWAPQIPVRWFNVPSGAAAVLARADEIIPSSAELVVSQGVVGRFSDRALVYSAFAPHQEIPLRTHDTWWVVAPSVGIETEVTADGSALVAELAGPLHADLVMHGSGIWVFHWTAPADIHSIRLPQATSTAPVWLYAGVAGTADLAGSPSSWHLIANGNLGYVLSGDYWLYPPGTYEATIVLSCTSAVNVEVWNSTASVLLARDSIASTNGLETISMSVATTKSYPTALFEGWGPFHAVSTPPPPGNQFEVRIWSAGGGGIDVQHVALQPVG
jgi:hypothetical protein